MFVIERNMPKILETTQLVLARKYHLNEDYNCYSRAYLFTTENISGYMDSLDMEGKDVLTVIGSGDHILSAVAGGATKVDAFDISGYALMAYYLKEAAIKTLEYEEYITYFLSSTECFNNESYAKIRASLRPDALTFWDSIYKKHQDNPRMILNLFREPENAILGHFNTTEKAQRLANVIPYFDSEKYYQLRENLERCQITCCIRDVKDLDDLGASYDYILLSNISKYQLDLDFGNFREAISRYISKLNILGEIKLGYFWGAQDPEYLKRCQVIRDGLNIDGIEITEIPSQYFELATPGINQMHDAVIGYKKSK